MLGLSLNSTVESKGLFGPSRTNVEIYMHILLWDQFCNRKLLINSALIRLSMNTNNLVRWKTDTEEQL